MYVSMCFNEHEHQKDQNRQVYVREPYPKELPDAAVLEGSNVTKPLTRAIYPPIM